MVNIFIIIHYHIFKSTFPLPLFAMHCISPFPIHSSHYVPHCMQQIAHRIFEGAAGERVCVPCSAILTNVTFIWACSSSLYQYCFEDTERSEFPLLLTVTPTYVQKNVHCQTFSPPTENLHLPPFSALQEQLRSMKHHLLFNCFGA